MDVVPKMKTSAIWCLLEYAWLTLYVLCGLRTCQGQVMQSQVQHLQVFHKLIVARPDAESRPAC